MKILNSDPASKTADVIVIGGGIHGCSAALHLIKRGVSVTVLEKDYVGRHASGVNAGGVRRLGREYVEVPLAQASYEYWRDIKSLVDDDCGYRVSRYLKVARSDEDMAKARQRVNDLNARGFTHEDVVDQETLRAYLPAIAPHCVGALHVDGDGSALPFQTTQAFKRRGEKLGVNFREETPVIDIKRHASNWHVETHKGTFEALTVINAAGAWGGVLAAKLGDDVPLQAHAPMLAITARMPAFATNAVIGALSGALSFKQFENGTVLIGGGVRGRALPDSNRTVLDMKGMSQFLSTACDVFPIMKRANIMRTWAGIEGYTPDNLPVISSGRAEGIVHAFGFSAHGFQLAPGVGEFVADLATGVAPRLSLDAFNVSRFQQIDRASSYI